MPKAQVSVTPTEAKSLIARAVSQMAEVQAAMKSGKILLKGGTTVSAIAEELVGIKMSISGRISPKGAKGAISETTKLHRLLIENGKPTSLDAISEIDEIAAQMGKSDILITGANAIDFERKTAMMVGHPLGGTAGMLPKIIARGVKTIITVGWEKLIPCSIGTALAVAGNQSIDLAMGMAVGLIPLNGLVVTETDSVSMLTGVKTTVIGAGGIMGGEGSTTFVMEGESANLLEAWDLINSIKEAEVSGIPETLAECYPGSPLCTSKIKIGNKHVSSHRGCAYFRPGLRKKVFSGNKKGSLA